MHLRFIAAPIVYKQRILKCFPRDILAEAHVLSFVEERSGSLGQLLDCAAPPFRQLLVSALRIFVAPCDGAVLLTRGSQGRIA